MAKRGYKLQEFVAHSSSINCLRIGRKARRFLLTGGDDRKLNLWAIGETSSLMSLCGHTSPVECTAFDSAEVLVLGGASSGTIKLWDLEEAKMVRTLNGHRLNCTAVEFHPFGEFFASGSADTDLKIWDIRKKGCIHTYKGHNLGINTIKFTPDGRWVVSGGFDNVVKVWDLTAGKLLHDFKFHDGYIRSLDFHPFEFLLATGSADRTVKFWDLETFEMIGSARAEATGVRAMTFHPDGRTLFCGYDDNLKVYSWEPVICHDTVDMGWSTLGDLCINEEKLIGCSYYQNSIGVWVADLSVIDPYGTATTPESKTHKELKPDPWDSPSVENNESAVKSTLGSRSTSPDLESKEIKNIYVDYEKPIRTRKVGSLNSPKVASSPFDLKESNKVPTKKQSSVESTPAKSRQARNRSFVVPNIVPRDRSGGKDLARSRRESFTPAKTSANSSVKSAPTRRTSYSKYDLDKLSVSEQPPPNTTADPIPSNKVAAEVGASDACVDKHPNMTDVEEKIEENVEHIPSNLETASFPSNKPGGSLHAHTHAVKVVNGVAITHGRTRSLVERFERRDATSSAEDLSAASAEVITDRIKTSTMNEGPQVSGRDVASFSDDTVIEQLMQNHDALLNSLRSRLTKIQVVRHFWERSDFRGAFNAIKKLPDHSVQADVISVLLEKMNIITLDLFSILLPVLLSLLDSKTERHAKMSLEVLLKLVAVFGPTINSSISAPPSVGVDLHQEQRIECCRECFYHLQKIRNSIAGLARRSGFLARSAQELNLVLQDHNIA